VAVSAQRRRRVLVAVVAALIAAGAFYLAIEYTNKTAPATATTGTGAAPTPVPIPTTTVVVASTAIPAGTLLSAANLKAEPIATEILSTFTTAGLGTDYPALTPLTGSKEYAAFALYAGLPIFSSEVTTTPNAASAPLAGLPAVLPSGYVALALPYNPGASSGSGMGTGGFIVSGDRIDILVNNGTTTSWAYQDVLVLAIGQSQGAPVASSSASPAASSSAAAAAPDLVMVELPRQDAAAMATIEDATGPAWTIQYLVVSSQDYPSASASPVPAIGAGPGNVTDPNSYFTG
jgi:Flp pilus assembly protein CpaB